MRPLPKIRHRVQVNLPFRMRELYLDDFLAMELAPEIGFDALALDVATLAEVREVGNRFRDPGRRITVHGPFMDLAPVSSDPRIRKVSRDRIFRMVALAAELSPFQVVCHAGWEERRHANLKEEWLEGTVAFWQEVADALSACGSRLVLENVYEKTPEELLMVVERLDGVGVCLDTGHQHAFGNGDFSGWLEALSPLHPGDPFSTTTTESGISIFRREREPSILRP